MYVPFLQRVSSSNPGLGKSEETRFHILVFCRLLTHLALLYQVIISGLSSPDVLTDRGFLNYAQSIGLYVMRQHHLALC